jgi:Fic family protein
MVNVIKETKGNAHFYYLRHHSGIIEKKRYLGKTIPKNIEQLKSDFLLEFYHDEWNPKIQEIYRNYQIKSKNIPKSIRMKNFESFGIAFTYNTQRIEGSSLTQSDTRDLLVFGVTPAKKQQSDAIETQKHYDLFMRLVTGKISKITQEIVFSWHREIFDQTKIGEAGHIRQHSVGVITNENINFASVPEIPKRLREFFVWLNRCDKNIVEVACLAHYKFVSIHPFADGNGRISRLITNYILYRYDYPMLLIKNTDRKAYFKALERSQLSNDDIYFKKWFMKYYIKANTKKMKDDFSHLKMLSEKSAKKLWDNNDDKIWDQV